MSFDTFMDVLGIVALGLTVSLALVGGLVAFGYFSHSEESDYKGASFGVFLMIFGVAVVLFILLLYPIDIIANFERLAHKSRGELGFSPKR